MSLVRFNVSILASMLTWLFHEARMEVDLWR